MKNKKYFKSLFHSLILIIALTFVSCFNFNPPENKILSAYRYQNAEDYEFRNIALLPLEKDDTTDTGTFYSTNHFLNILTKKYPKINFEVADIDTLIRKDSLIVPKLIDGIEKDRFFNLADFNESELGQVIKGRNYDAMFIGKIDSCIDHTGYQNFNWSLQNLFFEHIFVRECYFSYYLISLNDGKIIWRANMRGIEKNSIDTEIFYKVPKDIQYYPPLDCAISNGIDLMMKSLTFLQRYSI